MTSISLNGSCQNFRPKTNGLPRVLLAVFSILTLQAGTNRDKAIATDVRVNESATGAGSGSMSDQNAIKRIAPGITYQVVEIDPRAIAHIVRIDTKSGDWDIKPFMSQATEKTSIIAERLDAVVAVNCGFFNLSDGESASYIFIDGKQVCEPKHNKALVNNKGLQPFLAKIFNRSELRIINDKSDHTSIAIQPHSDSAPRNCKLVHSIQAGPRLLPRFTGREEAFIRRPPGASKDADSIGSFMRAARTAFGITDDGTAVIICVQGNRNKEFAEGISLSALSEFMKRIGCVEAINFDGGTSTTMVLSNDSSFKRTEQSQELQGTNGSKAPDYAKTAKLKTVVSAQPERQVKSIIYVTPRRKQ